MTGVDIYSQRVPDKKKIDEFIERRAKAAGIGKGEALAQVIDEAIARDLIGEHIAYGSQLATIEKLTGDIEKTVQALIIENEHARAELAKVRTDAAELAQAKFEAFKEHTAHALAAADERAHSLDAECNAAHKACARAKQQAEAARAKTASLAAELAAARAEAEAAKKQAERMADLLERLNTPAPSGGGKLEMTQ